MLAVKGWVPMLCVYGSVWIRALACKVHRTSKAQGWGRRSFCGLQSRVTGLGSGFGLTSSGSLGLKWASPKP